MAHHAQIVADEQIGQAQFVLQRFQQVHYLRLNGHIKGGNRLIADDKLGLQRQRPRDPDPLALPPGKRMWIAVGELPVQPDLIHQLIDTVQLLRLGPIGVLIQRLTDNGGDSHARIEAGLWVLKHHLHGWSHTHQRGLRNIPDLTSVNGD